MNWYDPPLVIAAAMLAVGIGVVLVAAAIARRGPGRGDVAAGLSEADLASLRNEVAELAGQLEDFARVIDKRVDERLTQLQELLAETDSKIRQLKHLTAGGPSNHLPPEWSDRIVALAAQGLGSVEIARKLQIDVGEVDLALNLYRTRSRQDAAAARAE